MASGHQVTRAQPAAKTNRPAPLRSPRRNAVHPHGRGHSTRIRRVDRDDVQRLQVLANRARPPYLRRVLRAWHLRDREERSRLSGWCSWPESCFVLDLEAGMRDDQQGISNRETAQEEQQER